MQQLKEHNLKGMCLQEILSYMKRDFSHYSWSLITLNRRLTFLNIYCHDKNVTVDEVTGAIKKECEGPGQLLGYRAVYHKIRQVHDLNVTRDQVYAAMTDVDPVGLENRKPIQKAHIQEKEKIYIYIYNIVYIWYIIYIWYSPLKDSLK